MIFSPLGGWEGSALLKFKTVSPRLLRALMAIMDLALPMAPVVRGKGVGGGGVFESE